VTESQTCATCDAARVARLAIRLLLLLGAVAVAYLALSLLDRPAHADPGQLSPALPPVAAPVAQPVTKGVVLTQVGGGADQSVSPYAMVAGGWLPIFTLVCDGLPAHAGGCGRFVRHGRLPG
jgi:hypothetical protein